VPTATHRGPAPAVWVALVALALALAAGLWLAFDPYSYSGVSGSATSSGVTTEQTENASLIEENGSWVIGLLAVPVALAGLGVLGTARRHRILAWSAAGVLVAFSLVTGFSIGLFYAPAAVALLVAAALNDSRGAPSRD
jgi:hypothetical protein